MGLPLFNIVAPFLGNAVSNVADKYFAQREANKAREFSAEQAELQHQWDIEARDYDNIYNSPLADRERKLLAGINPNLNSDLFGASNTQQTASAQTVKSDTPQGRTALDDALSILSYNLDYAKMQKELLKTDEEIKNLQIKNDREDWLNSYLTSSEYLNDFRQQFHFKTVDQYNKAQLSTDQYDVYHSSLDYLKKLPKMNYDTLEEKLHLLEEQRFSFEYANKLKKEFNIDMDADIWNNLVSLGLRDPDGYHKVISALISALKTTVKSGFQSVGNFFSGFFE